MSKILEIENIKSEKVGRCYYAETYVVKSTLVLNDEKLQKMFHLGLFGAGQEFRVRDVRQSGLSYIATVERRTDSGD